MILIILIKKIDNVFISFFIYISNVKIWDEPGALSVIDERLTYLFNNLRNIHVYSEDTFTCYNKMHLCIDWKIPKAFYGLRNFDV